MDLCEVESVLLGGEVAHFAVGLPIVEGHGGEVVEGGVQIVDHVACHVNNLLPQKKGRWVEAERTRESGSEKGGERLPYQTRGGVAIGQARRGPWVVDGTSRTEAGMSATLEKRSRRGMMRAGLTWRPFFHGSRSETARWE